MTANEERTRERKNARVPTAAQTHFDAKETLLGNYDDSTVLHGAAARTNPRTHVSETMFHGEVGK